MRRIFSAAMLLALAACDSGGVVDRTVRQGVRQSAVEACIAWAPQSDFARAAGLDPEQLCACAADKLMKNRTVSDLGDLASGSGKIQAAAAQCVAERQGRSSRAEPS